MLQSGMFSRRERGRIAGVACAGDHRGLLISKDG
jgi:hypothetical protein